MQVFFEIQKGLLEQSFLKTRGIFHEIDFTERLIGLVGPRGVGKSTMLLEYLRKNDLGTSLYISADNIYFLEHTLFDFALRFKREYNWKLLIIDEIHKYRNWNQELKNIYDSFPDLQVVFSGSSSLDLHIGNYDLSRRARLYRIHGFSFREYLNYRYELSVSRYSFDEIIENHLQIAQNLGNFPVIRYFREYLREGYYPYYVNEKQKDFSKILETVNKTIYDDIANFYNLKTENLPIFKKILNYLSVIEPGEINSNKISKTLEIDNKTVHHYLELLEKWWLLRFLLKDIHGYNVMKNTSKIYLENTNLLYAINTNLLKDTNTGMVRETFFLNTLSNMNIAISFSKIGDFMIGEKVFEVGWENKTFAQLQGQKNNSFLVLDNIVVWEKNTIPLYLFGCL